MSSLWVILSLFTRDLETEQMHKEKKKKPHHRKPYPNKKTLDTALLYLVLSLLCNYSSLYT